MHKNMDLRRKKAVSRMACVINHLDASLVHTVCWEGITPGVGRELRGAEVGGRVTFL